MRLAFFLALALAATFAAPNSNLFLEDTTQDDYYISNVTATYIQAYLTCKRYGYILAMERTEEETKIIDALIKSQKAVNNYFYLGGYKEMTDFGEQWTWIDINERINYDHWYTDPSEASGCLVRTPLSTAYEGKWSFDSCTYPFYFICQKAPTNTDIF